MKIPPLGYLAIFLIGGFFYFLSPQPTGSEMWVSTLWIQELPPPPFESESDSRDVLGFSVPRGAGAIDPEIGLVRWYQSRDFVSVSDKWLVNYDYSDGILPLISLTTPDIYPNPPGESPLVREGWVFSLGQDLSSLRFSRDSLPPEFSSLRQWASVLTFIETSRDFIVGGLADGRIWILGSNSDEETYLEPFGEWYTQGEIIDRVPAGAAVFDSYGFVVYGAIRQRGVLWNLQTGEEISVQEIPGEGTGSNFRIPWFSPAADLSSMFLERDRDGIVHTIALSQGGGRNQSVPWESVASFGYLQDSGLGYFVEEQVSTTMMNFFRPFDETKFLLHTQPFEGSVFSDNSSIYWIGNQRVARFDLGWTDD